jgi:alkylation response protein AidB-like acyl-CoA dehydrogenase
MARGELIAAIAMTEPDAGSELAALRTRATADGEHYRLRGSKTFITNGARAGLVAARIRATPRRRYERQCAGSGDMARRGSAGRRRA